ncbi:glycosyltransferase family 2 protein [Swingsia samuiensis]|uniref:Uncharacterized protein n=1 Tax=Swingsia samuiensis TaxID=1293412 RepID=A0A4Y6UKP6_9PROT|nr:glycosyltransferase family 2 protein [Swingsia samuiensis]QDH17046.1 hypothetical protein E3D00_05315 [Swingsia samuiensis]
MTVIRCLTMQKNESKLLEPWILWHGAICGFSNLTIVDNGSTDPRVENIQAYYESQGVEIIRKYNSHDDFLNKGQIFKKIIQQWDKEKNYDFVIPMDCDEFIAYFLERLSVDPVEIRSHFENMKDVKATFLTDRLLLNIPNAPNYYRPQSVPRALFQSQTIVDLDRGLHAPQTIHTEKYIRTPFIHIHLHNRPNYEEIRRFAREKISHIAGAIPGEAVKPGQITPQNPDESYHLKYYFLHSEEEFLQGYRFTPDLYAPIIAEHFKKLGVDPTPILGTQAFPQPPIQTQHNFLAHRRLQDDALHEYSVFDPLFYAYENPDVTKDTFYGKWPILHYMDAGWHENRLSNPFNIPSFILKNDL